MNSSILADKKIQYTSEVHILIRHLVSELSLVCERTEWI